MASLAPALIAGGASLIGGIAGGKGASKAAKIQAQAYQQGIAEQQREYNQTRSDESPFLSAGTSALTGTNGLLALLGLGGSAGTGGTTDWASYVNSQPDLAAEWQRLQGDGTAANMFGNDIANYGQYHYNTFYGKDGVDRTQAFANAASGGTPAVSANDAQSAALASLKNSPLLASIMGSGTDAILQNAAATGGLRGGNTQDALSRLGAEAYSSVYQNQLSNLMQLAGIGQNAASGLASAGQANANAQSSLLGQMGGANATAAASPYAGLASGLTGVANAAGNYYGQNSLAQLLKTVTGGSGGLSSGGLMPTNYYGISGSDGIF